MSELSALRAELKNIAAVIRETYLHGHFTQEQESIVFSLGKLTLRCPDNPKAVESMAAKYDRARTARWPSVGSNRTPKVATKFRQSKLPAYLEGDKFVVEHPYE